MTILNKTQAVIFVVVCVMMVLDFVSGTISALATDSWASSTMRKGLLHKCSLLICVALGIVLDFGQQFLDLGISVPAYEAICIYIILMEAGSCVENLCKANPDLMPDKLKNIFGLKDSEKDDK